MNRCALGLTFAAIVLCGCGTTKNVAVTSYHITRGIAVGSYRVATAPVHYALRKRGESSERPTIETLPSEVSTQDQPVQVTQETLAPQPRRQSAENRISDSSRQVTRRDTTQPIPPPSSHAAPVQSEFPTAKAVPGKAGYVVSPSDSSGRYVDVSGYASGSKVKDPWTNKIFIVP